jgi:hypothetical protein
MVARRNRPVVEWKISHMSGEVQGALKPLSTTIGTEQRRNDLTASCARCVPLLAKILAETITPRPGSNTLLAAKCYAVVTVFIKQLRRIEQTGPLRT